MTALLVCSDIAAFLLALAIVWLMVTPGILPDWVPVLWPVERHHLANTSIEFAILLAALIGFFAGQGRYQARAGFWVELQQVALASLLALLGQAALEFAFKTDASRAVVLGTWLVFLVLLVAIRPIVWSVLTALGLNRLSSLVMGEVHDASRVVEALAAEPKLGFVPVGVVSPAVLDRVSPARSLNRILQQYRADLLIVAPGAAKAWSQTSMEALLRERVPFALATEATGHGDARRGRIGVQRFRAAIGRPAARDLKVALDVIGSLTALAVSLPILVAIAAAVKLDGGPIFYAHRRIGRDRRPFFCLKFRTMRSDSAEVLEHILRTDPASALEWATTQKLRNDPRVTPIGAFLRRTSLDEVPQLLNVLRLEMSLVGPRPIVADEVHQYGDDFAHYCDVRPGLTGLWQVSGRSDTSYAERVALDTRYVRNWTLMRDLSILVRTVPAVLKRRGAL